MNVNELVKRIVDLSHHAGNTDLDLQGKALGWVNAAYHEILDELVPYLPQALQVQETVLTDAQGVGVLVNPVYRLVRVAVPGLGKSLQLVTPAAMLDADPAGTASGEVMRAYAKGKQVVLQPGQALEAVVLYVPVPDDLVAGGEEEDVLLPRNYHHALVWGGLVWSSVFERGFLSQSEMLLYQRQWNAAKEQVKLGLLGNTAETLRVRPYRYL